MIRFAANLHSLFTELPFLDRFAPAAEAGFAAVEFTFPYDVPADRISERLQRHGLKAAMLHLPAGDWTAGDRGLACQAERFDEFRATLEQGVAYARTIGADKLVMMAGIGSRQDPQAEASFRRAVAFAGERLEREGLCLLLKPLDPREIPGYFLTDFCHVADLVAELGVPHVKMLFDVYQRQLARGDVAMALRRRIKQIGHVQVAAVPDRGEPDDGELNYTYILRRLECLGYDGYIGCDYRPRGRSTLAGLGWMKPYLPRVRAIA